VKKELISKFSPGSAQHAQRVSKEAKIMRRSTHNVILMPSRLGKYTRASGYSFMFYSIESVNFFFFCSMSKHICNMIIPINCSYLLQVASLGKVKA
jgi:hypothetical protein